MNTMITVLYNMHVISTLMNMGGYIKKPEKIKGMFGIIF